MSDSEDDTKYKCGYPGCGGAYADTRAVRRHIRRSHDDPLVCKHCGRKLNYKRSLDKHLDKHERPAEHACFVPGCNETFWRQDILGAHLLRKHGDLLRSAVSQVQNKK